MTLMSTVPSSQNAETILLFDGVCNLCNSVVQFIIPLDPNGVFKFASQQSEAGQKLLEQHQLPAMNTVVLIANGQVFSKSDAVLEIGKRLGAPWSYFGVFRWLPKGFRDFLYDVVAKNRYRVFGQRESCWLPTPELRARFLDIA